MHDAIAAIAASTAVIDRVAAVSVGGSLSSKSSGIMAFKSPTSVSIVATPALVVVTSFQSISVTFPSIVPTLVTTVAQSSWISTTFGWMSSTWTLI